MNDGDYVNPYFACYGVQGLLLGTCKPEDLAVAQRYIDWHCKNFILWDGEIPDYEFENGEKNINIPDSVDSYIAVFLSLLCQKAEVIGPWNDQEKEAVELGMKKLQELTENGLTAVNRERDIFYFMDNIEVINAYNGLLKFMEKTEKQEQWINTLETMKIEAEMAIRNELWNEKEYRFEIGRQEDGDLLKADSPERFYPDSIVQVYGAAFGMNLPDRSGMEYLYKQFCGKFQWEKLDMGEDIFYWSELVSVAIELGDLERAENYLENYRVCADEKRDYPFHIGTAGWLIKACVRLEKIYEEEMRGGLFADLIIGEME